MICIGLLVALILPDSPLRNLLKKRFPSENVIFRGLRLSLGHFGRQAPESHVSQNGESTSSLPPFIVDLLTFKDYPFFQWELQRVLKRRTSRGAYNGPKQQCIVIWLNCWCIEIDTGPGQRRSITGRLRCISQEGGQGASQAPHTGSIVPSKTSSASP